MITLVILSHKDLHLVLLLFPLNRPLALGLQHLILLPLELLQFVFHHLLPQLSLILPGNMVCL